jgi:uncharacterized LabA/DUF88 family protein
LVNGLDQRAKYTDRHGRLVVVRTLFDRVLGNLHRRRESPEEGASMRVGIFVDAGYFFKRCALVALDQIVHRDDIELDIDALITELNTVRMSQSISQLLRIYWYDAAKHGQMTHPQLQLAWHDNIKVRLGSLSVDNQQKGVDSLIVTDLAELARNGAIVDAVVLSGDEDVRVGLQIAQTHGVRVHLLGIGPAGKSQSHQLMWEADTNTQWDETHVAKFMKFPKAERAKAAALAAQVEAAHKSMLVMAEPKPVQPLPPGALELVVASVVRQLSAAELSDAVRALELDIVPNDTDRQLLKSSQAICGRALEHPEKAAMRLLFKQEMRNHISLVPAALPPG